MKALILAAGYATRLYPLTVEYPKPLLKVEQRPIIDYIVDKVKTVEAIDEIIVVTNSKFISSFKRWADEVQLDRPLTLVDDLTKDHADRRGAIGDMHFVIKQRHIEDDLLVVGGDNLFDGGLLEFFSFAQGKESNPVIGVYDIKHKEQSGKYGVIKMDAENRIVDFEEKPKAPKSTLIAMCLYYFAKDKLGLIEEYLDTKTDKHDATGFYIEWLINRVPVYGFVFGGRWYDIGDHEFYNEAKRSFLK